ncbi:ATP-binding cassette domain-containing protein [Legionella sp. MW5194]|uniref:ABC-F family ATP-binding cassette domain-containing protein n=1 Tax=Legionella sp. MW5194 TaxID=2662448 RepID=UPI00193E959E|nr:ATP-binding cassette domain-containing protein [Legionella sp. MW5194]QRN04213.1 ATP-binding cassette domain-containing protein [Legionella sp. MW5194]
MFRPVELQTISLSFSHKPCFSQFTARIMPGARIAIIGKNGSGKSSLLTLLAGERSPDEGVIIHPPGLVIGHVPQIPLGDHYEALSGAQRFHAALNEALAHEPSLLLLDEPTNHLDAGNRQSLLKFLDRFPGAVVIASHDRQLLRQSVHTLWHIQDNHQITVHDGSYDDYCQALLQRQQKITQALSILSREKKALHQQLMKEQERAKKKRVHGEKKYDGDKLALRSAQGRGQRTANKNSKHLQSEKQQWFEEKERLRQPEIIRPHFSLAHKTQGNQLIVNIQNGIIGYDQPLLHNIHFSLSGHQRLAVSGANGVGKSTLVKALLSDAVPRLGGQWHVPAKEAMGYLDQHYSTLNPRLSVYETIESLPLRWQSQAIRRHLSAFLFRKNEEVHAPVATLSGGEKARLALAVIAAFPQQLLILDEITNNLDLDTQNHVIEVLREFPGAMIVISHDSAFLEAIGVERFYTLGVD